MYFVGKGAENLFYAPKSPKTHILMQYLHLAEA